ncbi:MAG: histidine phosphatase family protein, partial [Cyanobacteria bacterium J06649_4]
MKPSTLQPSTRIILVRHGRSTFNDQGRYQGSSNQSVLTSHGITTAQLVGDSLTHIPIDIIYT